MTPALPFPMVARVPVQISNLLPFRKLVRCTEAQKRLFVSPLLATLTHSLSRKSFPCHSYANTRGCACFRTPRIQRASSIQPPEPSASRGVNISPVLSSFRILPVATGVWPLRPLCSALRASCVVLFRFLSNPQACQLFYLHRLGASLSSLCTFFCIGFLCFQSFAASFPKTP